MKEGIHPNYREVCFMDMSNNFKFVTRSCANTKEMIDMEDGRKLPLYKLDTTSESHPVAVTNWEVCTWSAITALTTEPSGKV